MTLLCSLNERQLVLWSSTSLVHVREAELMCQPSREAVAINSAFVSSDMSMTDA